MRSIIKNHSPRARCGVSALAWAFLAVAPGIGGVASPSPAPAVLETIQRNLAGVDRLLVDFVQERHLSFLEEPLVSEGVICFQKPRRIRWETTAPFRSILVSDGNHAAQFEWMNQTWRKLDLGLSQAIQMVMNQISGIFEGAYLNGNAEYTLEVAGPDTAPIIRLTPRNAMVAKLMEAIEIHMASDLMRTDRVVLREKNGDWTEIRFSHHRDDIPFPDGIFDLKRPAGLETIPPAATDASGVRMP